MKELSIKEENEILESSESFFEKASKVFFLVIIIGFYLVLNLAMTYKLIEHIIVSIISN